MTGTRNWYGLLRSVPAQSALALSFDSIGLFAGVLVALFAPLFSENLWILALYPPLLTVRGNLSGIFSGNLTTMLHLGLILPRLRNNTEYFRGLTSAIFVLTFFVTLIMSTISFTMNLLLGAATAGQLFIYIVIPALSCIIANSVSVPITSLVGIEAFKKGLDPDILVYPVLSSVNDVLVTASFVVMAWLVISGSSLFFLMSVIFVGVMLYCLFLFARNRGKKFFLQTVREGMEVITVTSFFGSINGIFLSGLSRSLTANPGLVVLYPALIDGLGDVGSIIGSITTTNLALGLIKDLKQDLVKGMKTIFQVEASAAILHAAFGAIAYLIVAQTSPGASLPFLVGAALISNLSSFFFVSLFAHLVAHQAYTRGMNPDNVVIPAITSTSDTAATLSLIPALALLKLLNL